MGIHNKPFLSYLYSSITTPNDLKAIIKVIETFDESSFIAFTKCKEFNFDDFKTKDELYTRLKNLWPKYSSDQKTIIGIKISLIIAENEQNNDKIEKLCGLYLLYDYKINN